MLNAQCSILNDQVHVWCANLDLSDAKIAALAPFLSPDEQTRANNFRFPHLKTRFIAARGILRQLLSNYLSISPHEVQFTYGDRGKPQLSNCKQDQLLQFNISHSQGYALYGFTYQDLIGVDIEYLREMPDALKIAQRFFTTREYKLLQKTAPEKQQALFFTLWTAKEAYLKAVGTGLAGALDQVEIELKQGEKPRFQAIGGDQSIAANWLLIPCPSPKDYIGAIAIQNHQPPKQIKFWHWGQDI